jgi:Zn finger protein HypA/HybF involved in hydrogenase expression
MSSNYPEGSMKGSGIYSEEAEVTVECENCLEPFEVLLYSDDWGRVEQDITCPHCGLNFTYTNDNSYSGPDEDAMYDRMREENL